jgi:hypothetical protein
MQGLLQEINNLLNTKYELNLRAITSNRPISYVRVPRTKSDNAFTNSKEWLDTAIKISGSQHGGTFESAYRITNHIIKFYNDSILSNDDVLKSTDERRHLATSKIGPASGPCSLTATLEGSLATAALDGDNNDVVSPSSSSGNDRVTAPLSSFFIPPQTLPPPPPALS